MSITIQAIQAASDTASKKTLFMALDPDTDVTVTLCINRAKARMIQGALRADNVKLVDLQDPHWSEKKSRISRGWLKKTLSGKQLSVREVCAAAHTDGIDAALPYVRSRVWAMTRAGLLQRHGARRDATFSWVGG